MPKEASPIAGDPGNEGSRSVVSRSCSDPCDEPICEDDAVVEKAGGSIVATQDTTFSALVSLAI